MRLPIRQLLALTATAALLVGCSGTGGDNGSTATTDPAATTTADPAATPTEDLSGEEELAETGGTCDATQTGAETPASPDAAASEEALAGVQFSLDDQGLPTVSFDAPLAVGDEVARVLEQGDGEAADGGSLVTFNYIVCDMGTGEKLYSTWGLESSKDTPQTFAVTEGNFGPVLADAFTGSAPGAQFLLAQPGYSAEESMTGETQNGYLYAFAVTGTQQVLDSATGTEVTPSDENLPQVTFVDGKPVIDVPAGFSDPNELVLETLIQGDGPAVEAGQTVLVKYSGWLTDGTKFDSSWDREAPEDVLEFPVGDGDVIQGWDQGVEGQQVGSRVLLVVPSELGYGEEGGGEDIPGGATLIFVVDILAAY